MALISGICTQCGATLSADNTKDCMICPYCGKPFIVDKAIQTFNRKYGVSGSVGNGYGTKTSDFVIRAGVLEKYIGPSTRVTIPNNVIAIGEGAFRNCLGLNEIIIPEGVNSIGYEAFQGCKALKKVQFPNSLVEIGWYAFKYCNNLSEITLPDNITKIGAGAFEGCTNLTAVSLPNNSNGPQRYDREQMIGAFGRCVNLKTVVMPNNSWREVLDGSPYLEELDRKKWQEEERIRVQTRKKQGVCAHCGGSFKGFFEQKCSKCGKRKDY